MTTDMAVRAGSSCLACWPCSEGAKDPETGDLKDRVCPNWRMAPGIFCLVSSVIAVACSLIWQAPSLCIAFVPAGGCSTYLIYLGWDFQHLQTFAESNDQLKESLGELETENGRLQEANQRLSVSLTQFQGSLQGLQAENGMLKTSNAQLTSSVRQLEDNVGELERVRRSLQISLEAEKAQLEILHRGLTTIQASAKQDHSTFADQLAIFIEQVELLQKTRAQFEEAGAQVKTQSSTLLESAHMLKEIFSEIRQWKDGEEVKRRLALSQDLGLQVTRLQEQLGTQRGQLDEQKKQIEEMSKIKAGFQTLLDQLLVAAGDLKKTNGALAQEVEKAAKAFKDYALTPH